MDHAVDRLARRLASVATSRRRSLAGLVAVSSSALVRPGVSATTSTQQCTPSGSFCGKGSGRKGRSCRKCCTRFAISTGRRRRCACKPDRRNCRHDAQCCSGICDRLTRTCGEQDIGSEPIVCNSSVGLCQGGAPHCAGTSRCSCITTTAGSNLCTDGSYKCFPAPGSNVTCQVDQDCFDRFGAGYICVSTEHCPGNHPCSGSGGTVCMNDCPG
jgi:hypothetical protein